MKDNNKTVWRVISGIFLIAILCLIVFFLWYSGYAKQEADKIVLKSRYTYSVDIDSSGNVVDRNTQYTTNTSEQAVDFSEITINKMADIWTQNFLNQFTESYLSLSKSLKKVNINEATVLDEESNTVLISFEVQLKDTTSEYFSSWKGVMDNGVLKCEWVMSFNLEDNGDGTATIYVESVMTPEDYGIAQYNSQIKANVSTENNNQETNNLTDYEIKNSSLYVTYDGGVKYTTVPIEIDSLVYQDNSSTKLKTGSYVVNTFKTAFLYGGKSSTDSKKNPLTLMYSDDKGGNWVTSEIAQIYNADYYYVNFFDELNGIIVVGYDKDKVNESSRIYSTSDGGETWNNAGSGPASDIIKGVLFIDENVGFFCYDYKDGMDSNLYITNDGCKTFSKIEFEAQKLDSTAANIQTETTTATPTTATTQDGDTTEATTQESVTTAKLEWKDVYKEALVPVYDKTQNVLTAYLTQGTNGVYNNGKTAARYQSTDKGVTWKYIGQLELTVE